MGIAFSETEGASEVKRVGFLVIYPYRDVLSLMVKSQLKKGLHFMRKAIENLCGTE